MITNPRRLQTAREQMEADRRQSRNVAIGFAVIFACCIFLLVGCSTTVSQEPVGIAAEASFDGNAQNSGIVASIPAGFIVTDNFRARYNALIKVYGEDFKPALKPDAGIGAWSVGHHIISKEHMVKFLTMNQWARMARIKEKHRGK